MTTNRYSGTCVRCGALVQPEAGSLLRVDGASVVVCRDHAPVPQQVVVDLALDADGRVTVRPAGFLGADRFSAFRAALTGSATYNRDRRVSLTTVAQVGSICARLAAVGFAVQVAPALRDLVVERDREDAQIQGDAVVRASQVDQVLRASGGSLMDFQRDGVAWLSAMPGAILADEMGLGKTIQVLIAAPAGAGILVVCPKVAKAVWRREAARWRPDLQVAVLEGRGSFRWPTSGELVVTNYDVLPSLEDCAALVASPPACTLVADEAHVLKSGTGRNGAGRAKAFRVLADAVRGWGGRTWLVTGSPLLNSPPEIWNLLGMVGQTGAVFGTYDRFRQLYGGRVGTYGTVWTGQVDESVPGLLRRAMLRRLKADVATQIPSKLVEVIDVDLDAKASGRAATIMARLAKDGVDVLAAVEALRTRAGKRTTFEEISKVRELISRAKLAAAVEMVEELEALGEPVVVMSAHRAPADTFATREGWAVITGDTSDADRGSIAERFQRGELRGVAGTLQAMGVAITLTRAHEAIIIDPLWTPDLNRQGEDRIHRIGQEHPVRIRYLRVDHPVDHRVFDVCGVKRALAERSIDAAATQVGDVAPRVSAVDQVFEASSAHGDEAADQELADLIALVRSQRGDRVSVRTRARATRKAAQVIQSRGYAISAAALATPARPPRTTHEVWAAQAICQLAGACDGAVQRDGAGFAKPDTTIGHALATSVSSGLSDAEWQLAVQLCMGYPRQVGRPSAQEDLAAS